MPTNLLDILARRAHEEPSALAYRYLRDATSENALDWTYAELAAHAAGMAASLRERGVTPGRRVLLALDPGMAYVGALYGILAAGATAVPAFPPDGRRSTARFLSILVDSRPDMVLAGSRFAERVEALEHDLPSGVGAPSWWLDDLPAGDGAGATAALAGAATNPALLQYTSGSTGDPKGIVLTHENLISNCRVLGHHAGSESDRVGCSWLPPYHDMGLMGTIMFALYGGWPLVMLSPLHFIQRPYRWLKAITDHAVTITVGPNFSFDLCTDHIDDDELAELDLSTLRQVFCGSETVHRGTLARFRERFASRGYDERSLIPCYGLAEATLFVSGKPVGAPVRTVAVDAEALAAGEVRARDAGPGVSHVVSCGRIADGHEVVIADERGRVAGPGEVGEICVKGPNVAAGYVDRPDETRAVFGAELGGAAGPFLRTGDLGFLLEGELFVTGRLKDLIVIAGRNLYPQDIERSVRGAHPQIRLAVAFAVEREDGEELIVVAEYRGDGEQFARDGHEVREAALAAVVAEHGVLPAEIRFTPAGRIPTTTSGKVQRRATRDAYLQNTLRVVEGDPAAPAPAASRAMA